MKGKKGKSNTKIPSNDVLLYLQISVILRQYQKFTPTADSTNTEMHNQTLSRERYFETPSSKWDVASNLSPLRAQGTLWKKR